MAERKTGIELGDIGLMLSTLVQFVVVVGGVGFIAVAIAWWFIKAVIGLF